MKFIDIKATKKSINNKNGGAITYESDVVTDGPGVILMDNAQGDYGVNLLSTYHPGGKVTVTMRASGPVPVKAYDVGDVVAKLAIF